MLPIARALTAPSRPFSRSRPTSTTSTSDDGVPSAGPPARASLVALPSDADAVRARHPASGRSALRVDLSGCPDAALVHAARLGHPAAFDELFRRHRRTARAVARHRLHREGDADDAVAEAFTRAFEHLGSLRSPERFRAFLLAIVRSVTSDRRRAARRSQPDPELDLRPAAGDVEAEVLSGEASRSLANAIERLPTRQRYAVRRFYWDEVPVPALARELGVSVNATTQLLFRARAGLALQTTSTCRRPGRGR